MSFQLFLFLDIPEVSAHITPDLPLQDTTETQGYPLKQRGVSHDPFEPPLIPVEEEVGGIHYSIQLKSELRVAYPTNTQRHSFKKKPFTIIRSDRN